jgi:hypothetical protein
MVMYVTLLHGHALRRNDVEKKKGERKGKRRDGAGQDGTP